MSEKTNKIRKTPKKLLSLLLAVVIMLTVFCCVPLTANAGEIQEGNYYGLYYYAIATFNPRVVKYGDINLDGYIDSLDTDYLYQYLGEYISLLTDEQFLAADVTGDGQVNVEDLSDLQRYLNGYITQFPVEE